LALTGYDLKKAHKEITMKKAVAIFCMAIVATVSFAGVGIDWQTSNGTAWHGATDLFNYNAGEGLLDRYSAIWQLIYSATDTIEAPDYGNSANGYVGTGVGADDVVWAQREIQLHGNDGGTPCADGTTWNNWMLAASMASTTYQDLSWTTAGFVYQRIFEGTPGPETYYYDSATLPVDTTFAGGTATPQQFYISPDGLTQPTSQFPPAVPEPATMGLLGLGALVMAIRRRRA